MFVTQLRIAKFRCLRDVEIGPFREPLGLGELIVLAGPNGSGKSSVLELLSYGIANRYSWQYYQSRRITEHSFAVRIGLTEEELRALEGTGTDTEALAYAKATRGYWVEVNFPDALDASKRQVNERVHGLVSKSFQNFTRKLGFSSEQIAATGKGRTIGVVFLTGGTDFNLNISIKSRTAKPPCSTRTCTIFLLSKVITTSTAWGFITRTSRTASRVLSQKIH